jgi:hypothetical protein
MDTDQQPAPDRSARRAAELTIDLPPNSAYRHAAWISFQTNHTKLQEYLP